MSEPNPIDRARVAMTAHRSRFRSAAHAEAHDRPGQDLPDLPHRPGIFSGQATVVTTQAGLLDMVAQLRTAGRFAFDSEFIGESTYHSILCLLQVATPDAIWLVDTLQQLDLIPFWALVIDPTLQKLVHAGSQDLEPAARFTGARPVNVLDSQILAGFASMAYPVALGKLVSAVLDVQLAKAATFTQWDARPLSNKQLRYAADDVRYLPAMIDQLLAGMSGSNREAAIAECDLACDTAQWTLDELADPLKIRGSGSLDGKQLAVLRSLYVWRDRNAERHDLPPRTLLRDEVLIDLARRPPKEVARLNDVRGMPRPVVETHGATIVELAQAAWAGPPAEVDRTPEPTPMQRFTMDALHATAAVLCVGRGIDVALFGSRADLAEFFWAHAEAGPDLRSPLLDGWRRPIGEKLVAYLDGRGAAEWAPTAN